MLLQTKTPFGPGGQGRLQKIVSEGRPLGVAGLQATYDIQRPETRKGAAYGDPGFMKAPLDRPRAQSRMKL